MIARVRLASAVLVLGCICLSHTAGTLQAADVEYHWNRISEGRWIGSDFWANRLQDWEVRNDRLECIADQAKLSLRTAHVLTHPLIDRHEPFRMEVQLGLTNEDGTVTPNSAAGFLIGAGNGGMDYRAASIIHQFRGPGAGLLAGVRPNGTLFFDDFERPGSLNTSVSISGALDRTGWKVIDVDSVESGSPASNILDGNHATIWHTQWKEKKPVHPHYVVIDMQSEQGFNGIAYQPRIEQTAGRIKRFQLYASNKPEDWGKPLKEGSLPDNGELQIIRFDSTQARFLKLVALDAHLERPSTTIAELYVLEGNENALPVDAPIEKLLAGRLVLYGEPIENEKYKLRLSLFTSDPDVPLQTREMEVDGQRLIGNVAIAAHPGQISGDDECGVYWFNALKLSGTRFKQMPERSFGPILATQYTLHENTLKMTAQLAPVSVEDADSARLFINKADEWNLVSTGAVIRPGNTVQLRVENWDSSKDVPFRVEYVAKDWDGTRKIHAWSGIIRKEPLRKKELVIAGFTGNHNMSHRIGLTPFDWRTGSWFPHTDVTKHVAIHDPDVLFFSGDQIYEGRSPTFADREHLLDDYLYKWYLWCWAYRDIARDIPCITIPDDHDVYQGNLWGEAGRPIHRDHFGGYVHPAEFVRMVERTQTSHLPDPFDATPVEQGIGVYYTDMTYGRVSFAILEDRKFKSGCAGRLPPTGTARPDHINDPSFDVMLADVDGVQLLGQRQLDFLDHWSQDWKQADMKIALSQTIFAGMATHHGGGLEYLIADLDSNGWPQSGRNRAIEALRKGFAFHLAGDQHLATIVHHGIDDHRDSIWSFCVPSIANFYPRKWMPKSIGSNRPLTAPSWQGDHLDGFKNKVTVFAATNPGKDMGVEPKDLHNNMPGYGIVRMNKQDQTITMECWPRFADPSKSDSRQYPGWPRTIKQSDNFAKKAGGYLPPIQVKGTNNPVIQVRNHDSGEVIYTLRVLGSKFQPHVFKAGKYDVIISQPDEGKMDALLGVSSTPKPSKDKVVVDLDE